MSVRDHLAVQHRNKSRHNALQLVCIAALMCVAACTRSRPDPVPEFTTQLKLEADKQPSVARTLSPGAYLIEVAERDIELLVAIDAAGTHTELQEQAPRHGTVYQVVSLSAPATVRIQVSSADNPTKRGSADVRISRWQRSLDAPPEDRELGFTALAAALARDPKATPDSWARAADKINQAITHFENAGDEAARAKAAYALANLQYVERDDRAAAVRAAEIAADAFDASDDAAGMQNAATLRAAAELELASAMNAGTQGAEQKALYDAADRRLQQAAKYFGEHGLPVRAAYAVNMRGIRALNVGAYEEAGVFFSKAVEMARANEDVAEQAKSLANLAWVHRLRGFISQAAAEYESLLPMVDRERQAYQYGALLANYGFCLIALGDFDRALELHTEALELFTKMGDEDERATELAALGGLYLRVGDTNRALETLRAAIVAQERLSDARGLASTLRVAANASSSVGQHDIALEYLRRSAQIDANPHDVARTRVLIAGELRMLGNTRAAESELSQALASTNALARANALEERARLRQVRRDSAGAVADLREADRQYTQIGFDFSRIDTNTQLSQLLLASGDVAGASATADEAVSIVRRIRVKSANPEWRARFLSAQYSPFEARIAADLASGAPGDVTAVWRGFRTAEEVRARSLADQLAFDPGGTQSRQDSEGDALRARLTSQQLRLESRVQRQDADEAGTLELRRDIEETRAQIDAHRLRQAAVESSETTLPDTLRRVQDKLPPDTVVLAYFVGDARTHAWLMSRKTLRHTLLPGRETIERAIDAAFAIQAGPAEVREAERKLGAMLLADQLDGVTEKRMLVIPDGPLNGVPFAALPVPRAAADLLIDRFVLGYAPSLALAMQSAPHVHAQSTRVAVISDPVYAPDDRRLPALGTGGNFRGSRQASPNKLTRLPYSALEAKAVVTTFGVKDTIELAGFDATPARVLQLASSNLAVLHFATHAVARKDSPEQSALFLSEYAPDGALIPDSRLTANDITRNGLRADVVVLSGCATGDGGSLRGEGVLGLTYGFLANGSGSVVASLWPVEDASTARLMNEFYRAYRISGRAAESLRTAQLRTRGAAGTQAWSSFVVRANGFP
jgi:CHAT domain-containing protein/tetratricopeptide (TPR) repeat protein